ncbi:helix-turn-helix domain-containing protein [Streptosporangiaceae bacterium NEAU-GS5]|nr:helix-turn-helix domain-containing protein [Streptosporangiaceae bacterium NEAU-GS5]
MSRATAKHPRRAELAAFLRSRRERIRPQDLGLPPGLRRRTPGLRREEVAQLAGVGVTWYTWLEQGRPINASVQVLDAIARTLRLDAAERDHLFRLADVTIVSPAIGDDCLAAEARMILDALDPLPAAVYNSRYDVLAWNGTYGNLFKALVRRPAATRNAIWCIFTLPGCCLPMKNPESELPQMVATLRAAFAGHMGEPAWEEFVRRLCDVSPEFARMWATHDVARPGATLKVFHHSAVGELRFSSTSLGLPSPKEARIVVYTPTDEPTRERVEWLREHPDVEIPDHPHGVPLASAAAG